MTDDEIIAAADRIKARRLNERRLASFGKKAKVMIRWDNPGQTVGESYTGIEVDAVAVNEAVQAYFAPLVAK